MPALPLIATALLEVKPDSWELQEGLECCSFFLNLKSLTLLGMGTSRAMTTFVLVAGAPMQMLLSHQSS